jgi:hypothetical protein
MLEFRMVDTAHKTSNSGAIRYAMPGRMGFVVNRVQPSGVPLYISVTAASSIAISCSNFINHPAIDHLPILDYDSRYN